MRSSSRPLWDKYVEFEAQVGDLQTLRAVEIRRANYIHALALALRTQVKSEASAASPDKVTFGATCYFIFNFESSLHNIDGLIMV